MISRFGGKMQAIEERIYYRDDPVRQSEQNKIADVMEGTFRRIKRLVSPLPHLYPPPRWGRKKRERSPDALPYSPLP